VTKSGDKVPGTARRRLTMARRKGGIPPLQGVTVSQSLLPLIVIDVPGCHKAVARVSQPVSGRHSLAGDCGSVPKEDVYYQIWNERLPPWLAITADGQEFSFWQRRGTTLGRTSFTSTHFLRKSGTPGTRPCDRTEFPIAAARIASRLLNELDWPKSCVLRKTTLTP